MTIIKPVRLIKTKYGTYSLHFENPNGRRRRLSVGSDYHHAQRLSVKFADWLLEGKDPEREIGHSIESGKRKSITLKEFFSFFFEKTWKHKKSQNPTKL